MAKYQLPLIARDEVAEGTMAFTFKKPAGLNFRAGQFGEFTLLNPPETDAEGNTRAFTIAINPAAPSLVFATRMRDTAFKRVMKNLSLGTEVGFDGPFGSFTLHNDAKKPAVFLMGGIGITPARSIIRDVAGRKLPHKIFLFYSNRRPEDAPFLDELIALQNKTSDYKLIAAMTGMPARSDSRSDLGREKSKRPWSGETGYIDEIMLRKYIGDLEKPIYYSAGPPAMVAAMYQMLKSAGVNEDNIRTEEFAGY